MSAHIGYWKIYVLVQCGRHILLWKWRSEKEERVEPSGKFMFQQISSNIAGYLCHVIDDTIKYLGLKGIFGGWHVSYNLWHNHPFDLVWFYAHTICIFIRIASEFIIFRSGEQNLPNTVLFLFLFGDFEQSFEVKSLLKCEHKKSSEK